MSKWSDPSPHLIRRYRILADMSIAEASEASNCAPNTILHAESGKHTPTAKTLTRLSNAYNCDITDFYEADVQTIRTLATNVIVGYFNDTEANPDRKAQIASHLLSQLPDASIHDTPEPTEAEQEDTDLLDEGIEPEIEE